MTTPTEQTVTCPPTNPEPAAYLTAVLEIRQTLRDLAERIHIHHPDRADLLLAAAVLGRVCGDQSPDDGTPQRRILSILRAGDAAEVVQ